MRPRVDIDACVNNAAMTELVQRSILLRSEYWPVILCFFERFGETLGLTAKFQSIEDVVLADGASKDCHHCLPLPSSLERESSVFFLSFQKAMKLLFRSSTNFFSRLANAC